MKNAIILHGSSGSPKSFWLPSIRNFLEQSDYEVWVPQLPKPEAPNLKLQLPYILKNGKFNKRTIVVGHSAACPLILSMLENITVQIKQTILVSGYARPLNAKLKEGEKQLEKDALPILQESYDWQKIKNNTKDIYFINSDNDPWGCNDQEGRYMFDNIGGTLIVRHGEGHMGSNDFNQPYKKFPFLEKLIIL